MLTPPLQRENTSKDGYIPESPEFLLGSLWKQGLAHHSAFPSTKWPCAKNIILLALTSPGVDQASIGQGWLFRVRKSSPCVFHKILKDLSMHQQCSVTQQLQGWTNNAREAWFYSHNNRAFLNKFFKREPSHVSMQPSKGENLTNPFSRC